MIQGGRSETVTPVSEVSHQGVGTRAFSSSLPARPSGSSSLLPRPEDHRAKHEQGNDEDDEQLTNHGLWHGQEGWNNISSLS